MRRRHSLFGPLLLILIGTLLLVRNFLPEFPFWELVAKYWPVVLLVWGVAKLAEALQRPAPGEAAWRPSLTMGEFFLALLLVLVGISASKWSNRYASFPIWKIWERDFYFTQNLKMEAEPRSPLRVEIPHGDLRIVGMDVREITAAVNKRVSERSENEAKLLDARTQAELVREGRGYVLRAGGHGQVLTDMEITVPKATPLRLEVRRGSIEAHGAEGDLSVDLDRGDVSLFDINGNVKVQIRRGSFSARNVQGNVEVEGSGSDIQVADVTGQLLIRGEFSGASGYSRIAQGVKFSSSRTEMEIQKLPGKVDMTIGALAITQPGGMVSIQTRNKDIRVEEFAEKVQIINRGATVELRTTRLPLRDIEVENHSGPIEVAVPEKSEFQIEANARRGDVESDFPLEMQRANDNGWMRGKVGGAGATIKLNTSYGAISLRKAPPAPEPAPPPESTKPARPAEPAFPPGPRSPRSPRSPRFERRSIFPKPLRAFFPVL